jgi:hypothetical protein
MTPKPELSKEKTKYLKTGKTSSKEIARLKILRRKALLNAQQQRRRATDNQRVRAEFWEQVARDYTCEIKAIQKGKL